MSLHIGNKNICSIDEPCKSCEDAKLMRRLAEKLGEVSGERATLLLACKAQHEAIDRLFALLIEKVPGFMPSKSGQPWTACVQGNAAIAAAEGPR